MMHRRRTFNVADVLSIEELADKLTSMTWTLCTGFRLRTAEQALLFLNDSTSEDGAQEYAVFSEDGRQLESITFGWCDQARAETLIRNVLAGQVVEMGRCALRISQGGRHVCDLCR